ncbi:MAG TPA: nitroreductase family protein [Bacteroidota bacterium]|nr:nitroreductase family protein [Bacteroidota bacterium]
MNRLCVFIAFVAVILTGECFCQESAKTVSLPSPDTSGGKPLMQVLKMRRTSRSFSENKISQQSLSNLLWAAFGINRNDGHRTAPSAMNWQEIDLYVVTGEGYSLYDARTNTLRVLSPADIRGKTGMQDFVKSAPLTIVYVANLSKTNRAGGDDQLLYMGADCGFIGENVYLYCASEGLACVVRGSIDRQALSAEMGLTSDQRILLAQTVGYPK